MFAALCGFGVLVLTSMQIQNHGMQDKFVPQLVIGAVLVIGGMIKANANKGSS